MRMPQSLDSTAGLGTQSHTSASRGKTSSSNWCLAFRSSLATTLSVSAGDNEDEQYNKTPPSSRSHNCVKSNLTCCSDETECMAGDHDDNRPPSPPRARLLSLVHGASTKILSKGPCFSIVFDGVRASTEVKMTLGPAPPWSRKRIGGKNPIMASCILVARALVKSLQTSLPLMEAGSNPRWNFLENIEQASTKALPPGPAQTSNTRSSSSTCNAFAATIPAASMKTNGDNDNVRCATPVCGLTNMVASSPESKAMYCSPSSQGISKTYAPGIVVSFNLYASFISRCISGSKNGFKKHKCSTSRCKLRCRSSQRSGVWICLCCACQPSCPRSAMFFA
mmetsp:Transcript_54374/g.100427  ORF Transcript_54374/g.100427 Transcript_54374/m.100427 type:complete len:337 (-) Transcript_54374:39-1049(-)